MKLIRHMPLLRTSCKCAFCACMKYFPTRFFYNPQANYTTWIPYFTCSEKGTTCILHNATCVTYYKWALIWEEKFAKFFVRMKGTTADALYSHCGNFIIFLLLRFYVKSILGILKVQYLSFYHIKRLWNLIVWIVAFCEAWNLPNQQISVAKKLQKKQKTKLQFRNYKYSKIDFT